MINDLIRLADSEILDHRQLQVFLKCYLTKEVQRCADMAPRTLHRYLLSVFNYNQRAELKSSENFGFSVHPGDLCYIDFGRAYINESGYQHFGLVMRVNNNKALVIPMTSSSSAYKESYCEKECPCGKRHLMRLGKVPGLYKKSVLFLNDAKFINTARIIEVKGHLQVDSELYRQVVRRLKDCVGL